MFDNSVLNNQLANISPAQFQAPSPVAPANYSMNAGIENVMQNVNPEPGGWWQKTKDFFGSPFGRSVGAGLLTGGLVAASGGDGLEALSYGAQAGGRAADVNRNELARKAKRELEEKYFNSKLAEQQADREARQQELTAKAQRDKESADYKLQLKMQEMARQNELNMQRDRNKPLNLTDALALADLKANYPDMARQLGLMAPGENAAASVSVPYKPINPAGSGNTVPPQMTPMPKFVF